VLAVALALAVLAPAVQTWRAAASALDARACLWPAVPRADEPAHLLVVVPGATDRAAVRGPWAKIRAEWDMANMTMGVRHAAIQGTAESAGVYSIPLRLDMAGPWHVQLALQTPGRPAWQSSLRFSVASPTAAPGTAQAPPLPGDVFSACGTAAQERGTGS
jgi:hypothetical protein